MEMQYQAPEYLYLLWLIAPLLIISVYSFIVRKRKFRAFFSKEMQNIVAPLNNPIRYLIRDIILLCAFSLIVIAFARPRIVGDMKVDNDSKGVETMFCIDVSNSMLSKDVIPSRIEMAKSIIRRVVEKRPNDHIGIIVFAGRAFTLVPITSDLGTLLEFLQSVYPNMISDQGTNLSAAISLAVQGFNNKNKNISKEIVILTDGEDQMGGAKQAAEVAKDKGIVVNVIGVGSEKGGPIPLNDSYLKDAQGNTVITKFNQSLCESIANAGGGVFITGMKTDNLVSSLTKQIEKLPQTELDPDRKNSYIEKYSTFLWIALVILCLEVIILERKNRFFRQLNLFSREK